MERQQSPEYWQKQIVYQIMVSQSILIFSEFFFSFFLFKVDRFNNGDLSNDDENLPVGEHTTREFEMQNQKTFLK